MIARDPIDDCVHCGFCLPACPTYQSWSEEMDSPRGRIVLMKGLRDGRLALGRAVIDHFDRCLGCMGCVSACPSGVAYDVLIERTRGAIERQHARPAAERRFREQLFELFPYPARLRVAAFLAWLYAVTGIRRLVERTGLLASLPPRLRQLARMVPEVRLTDLLRRLPERAGPRAADPDARDVPGGPAGGGAGAPASGGSGAPAGGGASGPARATVGLLAGCVQRVFFPAVNAATLRVLTAEGCQVVVPEGQGCCGALSLHAGREEEARAFARALIACFEREPLDAVVVNAAGCGSALKAYGRLLVDDPAWAARAAAFAARVEDVSEFLVRLGPVAPRRPIRRRVAYHDACHLAHAQGVREPPRALLRAIPGLELVEIGDGDQCCGSAGIYNLLEPDAANEIGARKVVRVLEARPDQVASANPGCSLQLAQLLRAQGVRLATAHPIEILAEALDGDR